MRVLARRCGDGQFGLDVTCIFCVYVGIELATDDVVVVVDAGSIDAIALTRLFVCCGRVKSIDICGTK
jgi:hypothetical protein